MTFKEALKGMRQGKKATRKAYCPTSERTPYYFIKNKKIWFCAEMNTWRSVFGDKDKSAEDWEFVEDE